MLLIVIITKFMLTSPNSFRMRSLNPHLQKMGQVLKRFDSSSWNPCRQHSIVSLLLLQTLWSLIRLTDVVYGDLIICGDSEWLAAIFLVSLTLSLVTSSPPKCVILSIASKTYNMYYSQVLEDTKAHGRQITHGSCGVRSEISPLEQKKFTTSWREDTLQDQLTFFFPSKSFIWCCLVKLAGEILHYDRGFSISFSSPTCLAGTSWRVVHSWVSNTTLNLQS